MMISQVDLKPNTQLHASATKLKSVIQTIERPL